MSKTESCKLETFHIMMGALKNAAGLVLSACEGSCFERQALL